MLTIGKRIKVVQMFQTVADIFSKYTVLCIKKMGHSYLLFLKVLLPFAFLNRTISLKFIPMSGAIVSAHTFSILAVIDVGPGVFPRFLFCSNFVMTSLVIVTSSTDAFGWPDRCGISWWFSSVNTGWYCLFNRFALSVPLCVCCFVSVGINLCHLF